MKFGNDLDCLLQRALDGLTEAILTKAKDMRIELLNQLEECIETSPEEAEKQGLPNKKFAI